MFAFGVLVLPSCKSFFLCLVNESLKSLSFPQWKVEIPKAIQFCFFFFFFFFCMVGSHGKLNTLDWVSMIGLLCCMVGGLLGTLIVSFGVVT